MPCIIKNGVLQKYQPYTEEREIKTEEGIVSMVVSEVGFNVPAEVTSIGPNAFAGCKTLRYVEIPEGVEEIASFAFKDCTNLKSVTLPKGLKKIGAYAFSCCKSLESVELPQGLEQLGSYAFSYCQALKSVSGAPRELTRARSYELFAGCPFLKNHF